MKNKFRKNSKEKFNRMALVSKTMPPLYHKLPGQEFDLAKSEVLQWISSNTEIVHYFFDYCNRHKFIRYDSTTGKWQGVDYESKAD